MQLHSDVESLLTAMRALQTHLDTCNDFWAAKVERAADEVANSDAHGLQRFLSLFGGAGSLNDLVLQRDGVVLGWENDRLDTLRSIAWNLADQLRAEQK